MLCFSILLLLFMYPSSGFPPPPQTSRSRRNRQPQSFPPSDPRFWTQPSQPGSSVPALGSAWVDNTQRPNSRRQRNQPQSGQSPLTAVSPAPKTKPVPDVDSRGSILKRQYNLSTSPITVPIATGTNLVLFASPLSPLIPLQDGTNTHIMATESSNYAQYRVVAATIRFRPLVPSSVGGFAISMSFWPQSTTTPTAVDMNSITATDVRIILQPGLSGELVIPSERLHYRNQGWRSVETTGVSEEEATSGLVLLCVHGNPVNSFTNSPYSGALGLLDFAISLELRNLTPGNTNLRLSRYRAVGPHKITRDSKGHAILTTAAASRFMQDIHLNNSNGIGDLGRGIMMTLFNVADTLLGGLPTELIQLAGGQLLYSRPQVSANSEPSVKLYTSVENAQADHGIPLSHNIDLGQSAVVLQDYDNQHVQDRPTPAPAPVRPVYVFKTGDVLWFTLPAGTYMQAGQSSPNTSPAYWSENSILINVGTGSQMSVGAIPWDQATINGQPLPIFEQGSYKFYRLPLYGKLTFWQQGTTTAGYTYNYNTKDSDSLYFAFPPPHGLYISTYSTMLGTGPVPITGLGAVGPSPSEAPTRLVGHTRDDYCQICRAIGLPRCALAIPPDQLQAALAGCELLV
uniref:Pro-secreted protein ORF2 n=1 Tax=Spalax hepevirus TaxID=2796360 RepID=A0A8E0N7R1_9VIRU|nr:TPA: ORF2 protein [Spalax hepevirus]